MRETFALSWHIVRRNWTIYRKDLVANISPTVMEPAFLLLSLGLGLSNYVAQVEGRTYLQFLAPGLAVSTALFTAFFESSYGFFVRMTFENIFKAMLTTPIGIGEVVLGEFLWLGIKGALMMTCVSLVLALFGLMQNPLCVLLIPLVGVLMAVPLGAVGLISSCSVKNINQFQTVYSFIIAPLYFFSGIFFPVERMPTTMRWIAESLPLYHGVELGRAVFWNQNLIQTFAVHGSILLIYSVVLCFIAHRRVRQKLQS